MDQYFSTSKSGAGVEVLCAKSHPDEAEQQKTPKQRKTRSVVECGTLWKPVSLQLYSVFLLIAKNKKKNNNNKTKQVCYCELIKTFSLH